MISPATARGLLPFLPAKDFATSKRFYQRLGFTMAVDTPEIAVFQLGAVRFILQNYYEEQWASNTMLQLVVDDLEAWWQHVDALKLATEFSIQPPTSPKHQTWGQRVAFLHDPSNVLWHVVDQ